VTSVVYESCCVLIEESNFASQIYCWFSLFVSNRSSFPMWLREFFDSLSWSVCRRWIDLVFSSCCPRVHSWSAQVDPCQGVFFFY
jgi:hypothetical protein